MPAAGDGGEESSLGNHLRKMSQRASKDSRKGPGGSKNRDLYTPDAMRSPRMSLQGSPQPADQGAIDVHSGKIFNSAIMKEAGDVSFNLQIIGNSHKTTTQQDEQLTTPKMFQNSIYQTSNHNNNINIRENTQSFAGGGRRNQSDGLTSIGS
jgi:hypothetical protein